MYRPAVRFSCGRCMAAVWIVPYSLSCRPTSQAFHTVYGRRALRPYIIGETLRMVFGMTASCGGSPFDGQKVTFSKVKGDTLHAEP